MLSKNAEEIMHNLYKESGEHSWTYSISCESFKAAYQAALEEIEQLKDDYKSAMACCEKVSEQHKENEFLKEQVKQGTIDYLELEAKVAKYEDALKFYASHLDGDVLNSEWETYSSKMNDRARTGTLARQALAESNLPPDDNNCIQCEDL